MHKSGTICWLAIIVAGLAGCGQSTKESAAASGTVALKNASIGEVQSQVAAAQGRGAVFQPGHWEGSVKIVDLALGGMDKLPPAIAERMKAKIASNTRFASCLTPEDAADARKALAEHAQGDCRYEHFTMAGGAIDAALVCSGDGGSHRMTMKGSYTEASYHLVSQSVSERSGGLGGMSMKMELDARRTGVCTGKEDG